MKPERVRHAKACLIIGAVAALFYSPVLLGLQTFPDGDFTHHFLPFSLFQQSEMLNGQLPLWNPYTYSGHPFLADTQAAVFYPINLLMLAIGLPLQSLFDSAAAGRLYFLQMEAVLHVLLAGFFVYLLVNNLTRHQTAGLLAGITFAFSGYLTSYPPLQLAVLRTAIWLPLILYLVHKAIEQPTYIRWWIGFIFATVSAFMAGHPQTMLHIGYVVAPWTLFILARNWRYDSPSVQNGAAEGAQTPSLTLQGSTTTAWLVRVLGSLVLSVLAVVGLSAIQLVPSLEFLQLSVRAETSYDFVSAGFPIRDTWQFILPSVFTWFSPLYIGVVGLGLAISAVGYLGRGPQSVDEQSSAEATAGPHPLRAVTIFWLVTVVISLLVSYGRNGFLYPLFYEILPGWDLFRQQERAAYIVSLGLCVLAGIGFSGLDFIPHKRRRLLIVSYAAVVIGSVYTFGLLWQAAGETVISNPHYIGIAAGTLATATLLAVLLWWPGWEQRRTLILFVLTIGNLFAVNIATNLADFGPNRKMILSPEMEALAAAIDERSDANLGLPGRVYNEFRIYDDYGMRQSIEDVWGSSPLKLAAYAALFEEFPLDRMWRLTGVEHVLTWRKELFEPSTIVGDFPQSEDTTYLHRLAEPNPRAWMVPNVYSMLPTDTDRLIQLLADHQFDLETNAIITDESSEVPRVGTGSGIGLAANVQPLQAQINLNRTTPTTLRVNVTSEQAGFLVLSENYMPDLRVRLLCDDEPACAKNAEQPLGFPQLFIPQRTNLAFVGVTVPAGTSSFELFYCSAAVDIGYVISLSTLLILIIAVSGIILQRLLLKRRQGPQTS